MGCRRFPGTGNAVWVVANCNTHTEVKGVWLFFMLRFCFKITTKNVQPAVGHFSYSFISVLSQAPVQKRSKGAIWLHRRLSTMNCMNIGLPHVIFIGFKPPNMIVMLLIRYLAEVAPGTSCHSRSWYIMALYRSGNHLRYLRRSGKNPTPFAGRIVCGTTGQPNHVTSIPLFVVALISFFEVGIYFLWCVPLPTGNHDRDIFAQLPASSCW